MTKPVTLAAIAGAHGVAGEVRLKLFGEGASSLSAHKSFNDGALTLLKIRDDGKGGAIARFVEVHDRTAAEALRVEKHLVDRLASVVVILPIPDVGTHLVSVKHEAQVGRLTHEGVPEVFAVMGVAGQAGLIPMRITGALAVAVLSVALIAG